jgi:acylphosphatase
MAEMCHMAVLVSGHVQGVFYRAFTSRIAKSLGIKGYVRNLSLGGVEIHAEGYKDKLEMLVDQLKNGPPESLVDNVDVKWSGYTGQYNGFEVR